ncbi:MAG: NHLP bacteriocin export ABC transporter permease/ATPase subunit [Actinomycetota bacterium]
MLNPKFREVNRIKGNQPLLLDDPEKVWVVQSGVLAVFATSVEAGEPQGDRRYLFSATAGDTLFGSALAPSLTVGKQRGFLAVAIEETELQLVAFADWATQGVGSESGSKLTLLQTHAAASLDRWIYQLGVALSQFSATLPTNGVLASGSHFLSLQPQQSLQAAQGQVSWVEVRQGSLCWMGLEDLKLEARSPLIPLAAQMWLAAEKPVEVRVFPTAELESASQLGEGLAQYLAYWFHCLNLGEQEAREAQYRRFQERERLNRQLAQTALGELTAVLSPQQQGFFQEGTPLLVAAGAVGRAVGITVRPPGRSEDLSRVKDPLDAIARASQFRTRRVLLVGNWWRQENGPLLAYTLEEDSRPMALLPTQGQYRYLLFDPEARTRTPVTEAVAQTLSPVAYMFYRPLPKFVDSALQVFLFGIQGYEKDLIAIVICGILGTLLGMLTPQATAILINDAIPDSDSMLLWQLGLALFGAAFGQAGFQLAQGILTLRVESAADGTMQPAVWDRLINLKPTFFRKYPSGDLLNRLLAVGQIRTKLSGAAQRSLLSGVFSLLNVGLMFVYSVKLGLIGLGISLLVAVVTSTASVLLVRQQRQQEALDGLLTGLMVELINGVAKLRVAAAEERAFAAWAKKYSQRTTLTSGIQRITDNLSVFNEAVPLVSSMLIFWFAIWFIQQDQGQGLPGGLSVGTFLAFNSAFTAFLLGVTNISNTLTEILEVVPLWERAQAIVQGETESDPSKADPGRLTGRIALDHVTFRYREDGPLILDDVSIHAEPGEFVALVGPSGSGKSTVFRLLLGFETPLSGTVYLDGQDLAGLDVQAVRRQLGVVLQNVRISSAPIYESITSGALISLDEAWEAARMAGFAQDIEQMPMGMHTVLSEGGTNLSGGQRQRLLIARALVSKPKIILMDEATSALDNRTQAIVTESLDRMNATRIVIAHRLSTIRNADRIYVVESGRVVQMGTFDELLKQEGLFARLAARQLD